MPFTRKPKPKETSTALTIAGSSGKTGKGHSPNSLAALKRHAFKPGQSGNPVGRPRHIRDAYEKLMQEKTQVEVVGEDGEPKKIVVPRYEAIARAQIETASTPGMRDGVKAAEHIRQLLEPTEAEEVAVSTSQLHTAIFADFMRMARAQQADVTEID